MTRLHATPPLVVLAGIILAGALVACDPAALEPPTHAPTAPPATPTPVPSFVRPTPNEMTLCTSLMMAPIRSSMMLYGVSSRTAILPQPMSKPTPEMLICFS